MPEQGDLLSTIEAVHLIRKLDEFRIPLLSK
jgi:hypothetical protein